MRRPDVSPEVVAAAQRGDEQAFARIVEHYRQPVFGLAYRMCHDAAQADDLAQEAFLRAWRKLGSFDASRPLRPWLLRLAARVCINALRKRRTPTVSVRDDGDPSVPEPSDGRPDAGELAARREMLRHLEEAIARLPEDYRLVVTLRHVEDLSYEEIARVLDCPLGTVKVRLFRARERLREMMKHLLGDES